MLEQEQQRGETEGAGGSSSFGGSSSSSAPSGGETGGEIGTSLIDSNREQSAQSQQLTRDKKSSFGRNTGKKPSTTPSHSSIESAISVSGEEEVFEKEDNYLVQKNAKISAAQQATKMTTMNSIGSSASSSASLQQGQQQHQQSEPQTSIHDLIPAGLVKPSDGMPIVNAKYSKVSESLRRNTPNEMQCSMFCGGKKCKYENREHWKKDEMAIDAMARPNTSLIEKAQFIEQFHKHGIKSIINLQIPGEHASCGPKLNEAGFTYNPNDFMRNNIFFYNFQWKDYGEASMTGLLDMVKVLSFALSEGKVAVHCHAGLGRTGVLISCYLVYFLRVRSNDAIRYVRLKRPGAVQTRRQIDCVKEFEAFFLPQCLIFSNKAANEVDKKMGRFSVEQHLKRQKYVVHGYEARTLKHIPKIIFKISERLLRLCNCGPSYALDAANNKNFTHSFIAYKFDNKGSKLFNYNDDSRQSTPSDSITATRRSSRSMLMSTDDEMSTGFPTPSSRPNSETNSYVQSCSSALSGVDDKRLDEILGDGIKNQSIQDNRVTKELASHEDLQKAALNEKLPKFMTEDIYTAFMDNHFEQIKLEGSGQWASSKVLLLKQYRIDLNFKMSAWDRLDTETNLFVLSSLLLEWLEHLKSPVLDKDNITYVVIHCDNIEQALKKLPLHVIYILEYFVRFVARLQPLERTQSENIMRRLVASLTHQSVMIDGAIYPAGKKFPKLRGGTGDSTLKFLMKIYDIVTQSANAMADELNNFNRFHQMSGGGFQSLDASATSISTTVSNNDSTTNGIK